MTITVSKGSETVTVPDISAGTSLKDARKALQDAGLKVKVQGLFGGGGGDDKHVLNTDPSSGTEVNRGDTVTVYVY